MSQMMTIGNNTKEEMISLIAKDGISVSVPMSVAKISITIKNMLEDLGDSIGEGQDNSIPIPNINGPILAKIYMFCDYIHNNPDELNKLTVWLEDKSFTVLLGSEWFKEFLNVDQQTTFDIILGANFLDIQSLLNMECKYVASIIRNKTPDELRTLFSSPQETATVVENEATQATQEVETTVNA